MEGELYLHFRPDCEDRDGTTVLQKAPGSVGSMSADTKNAAHVVLSQLERIKVLQTCTKGGDASWVEVCGVKHPEKRGWIQREFVAAPSVRHASTDFPASLNCGPIAEDDDVMVLAEHPKKQICYVANTQGGVSAVPLAFIAPESDVEDNEDSADSKDSDYWDADSADENGQPYWASRQAGARSLVDKAARRSQRLQKKLGSPARPDDPGLTALASLAAASGENSDDSDVDAHVPMTAASAVRRGGKRKTNPQKETRAELLARENEATKKSRGAPSSSSSVTKNPPAGTANSIFEAVAPRKKRKLEVQKTEEEDAAAGLFSD
ncbi:unnamed protein product [Amoebophrya sp. A120]|nr:unnamed protein product [Amoebophrya sp. A120]|eukprot:GSA120T00004122001.1